MCTFEWKIINIRRQDFIGSMGFNAFNRTKSCFDRNFTFLHVATLYPSDVITPLEEIYLQTLCSPWQFGFSNRKHKKCLFSGFVRLCNVFIKRELLIRFEIN